MMLILPQVSNNDFNNNDHDDDELCKMLLATMILMHSTATGLLKLPHLDVLPTNNLLLTVQIHNSQIHKYKNINEQIQKFI